MAKSVQEKSMFQLEDDSGDRDFSWLEAVDYRIVASKSELVEVLDTFRKAQIVSIDLETTGLDFLTDEIVVLTMSIEEGAGYMVPFGFKCEGVNLDPQCWDLLRPFLEEMPLVMQGGKFDYKFLRRKGIESNIVADTRVMQYIIDVNQPNGLDNIAKNVLDIDMLRLSDFFPGKSLTTADTSLLSPEHLLPYACGDADIALRLYHVFLPRMSEFKFVYKLDMGILKVLALMEEHGIGLDVKAAKEAEVGLNQEILNHKKQMDEIAGEEVEVNSSVQLSRILYDKLKLPVIERTKKRNQPSTKALVMDRLAEKYPIAAHIRDFRSLKRLVTSYAKKLPETVSSVDGRIHANFDQCRARSGRIAALEPPLQQIPKRKTKLLRKPFVAAPGYFLLSADFSQIEFRVYASFAKEQRLLDLYERGAVDVHRETAAMMLGKDVKEVTSQERNNLGKTLNFGQIYGMSAYGVAARLGISESEGATLMERYFKEVVPGCEQFRTAERQRIAVNGYVSTYFGRRRVLPELNVKDRRDKALSRGVNTKIQGTAADILKLAMIRVHKAFENRDVHMVLTLHDELVFEISEKEVLDEIIGLLRRAMEVNLKDFCPLPIDIAIGQNWGELKSYKETSGAKPTAPAPATRPRSSPCMVIEVYSPVTKGQAVRMAAILRSVPGDYATKILLGDRPILLKYKVEPSTLIFNQLRVVLGEKVRITLQDA